MNKITDVTDIYMGPLDNMVEYEMPHSQSSLMFNIPSNIVINNTSIPLGRQNKTQGKKKNLPL